MRPQTPQEVLEAVGRLEADLEAIRRRAAERERDMDDLRAGIREDAAAERVAVVEDLERIVDLIGASWRSTNAQLAALTDELNGLRRFAETTATMLRGASVELHLGEPVNGVH